MNNRAELIARCLDDPASVQAALDLAQRVIGFIGAETHPPHGGEFSAPAPAPSAAPPPEDGTLSSGDTNSATTGSKERKHVTRIAKASASKTNRGTVDDQRVLDAVAQAGSDGIQRGAIMRATKLSKNVVPKIINRLLHEKRLRLTGRFNGTRYFIASGNGRAPAPTKPKPKTPAEPDEATRRILAAVVHAGDTGLRIGSVAIVAATTESRATKRVTHLIATGAIRAKKSHGATWLFATGKPATAPPAASGYPNGEGPAIGPGEPFVDDLGKAERAWATAIGAEHTVAYTRAAEAERAQHDAAAKG